MFRALALSLCASAFIFAASAAYAQSPDPTGLWLTENKRSAVKIEKCGTSLCGKIAWIIKGGMSHDSKNPAGDLRTRPMCGIPIIYDFKNNPNNAKVWEGGKIYKADEGSTYSATISVTSPTTLYVRGYVGLPLFGKSQTWTRVSDRDYPACKS